MCEEVAVAAAKLWATPGFHKQRILLANSGRWPFGRNLGELGQTGKSNPLSQTSGANSPTVSNATRTPFLSEGRGRCHFAVAPERSRGLSHVQARISWLIH
jgi:hypothetical protein